MPKISQHSYDIAVVAVRRDHTSGVSVLKVYRPCAKPPNKNKQHSCQIFFIAYRIKSDFMNQLLCDTEEKKNTAILKEGIRI